MSHFALLRTEWPQIAEAAERAELLAYADPRAACFYSRRALELTVRWVYKHDPALQLPYQDHLSALIHEPTFRDIAGDAVFNKARVIVRLGNEAVHSQREVREFDALTAVRELFHIAHWLAWLYSQQELPAEEINFDPDLLPRSAAASPQTVEQLQQLEAQLKERDEKLTSLLTDRASLDAELQRLRSEIAEVRRTNATRPDPHDYSEAETRVYLIDVLLREAGWTLDQPRDREFEVTGMPNQENKGYVDYVLWGDDGKPLALIEAKRTTRDPRVGQQQAKLYADCLERQFGQRPVIFYTNGYENWLWDDITYPPRMVQGFYKKVELELLIQRRQTRKALTDASIDDTIVERYYQTRAIRRIGEAFEREKSRRTLLVMATGAGKTRTVIALADLLMKCNWAKRVLFLADRVALVKQAVGAFKRHLPDAAPVNLVTEKNAEGRVFVSTYPTMMNLINEMRDGQRRFGVGHFDLVVIDEAHRSVFRKYRAIFDYFDSLLVGLTATPKDEVDRNTYSLFNLETGVPTDAYSLDEAVADKFLVPAKAVSVPLKFQREGIKYDDLSDEDKEAWDAIEWDEEGGIPDRVDPQAINRWLFNIDTVDKVLEHLMTRGQKVAGGDRLGKTIVFAKNHFHAEFIAERFNANYPHYRGEFARVIDFTVTYAQTLIDDFSIPSKAPHIAISVDMLDTGIDVPEVVNLVFFKMVHSKTKFWQMVGRGTRLCTDLFGPGQHKQFFYIFDYCQNLEFFSQNPAVTDGAAAETLGKKLFVTRLALIEVLEKRFGVGGANVVAEPTAEYVDPRTEEALRQSVAELLRIEVAAMNLDNFVVRPKRRMVEKYSTPEPWHSLTTEALAELGTEVAGLPSELAAEAEETKRFDLLMLNLQLAVLQTSPNFGRLHDQVKSIVGVLEEMANIPMVQQQLPLIEEMQTDEWWQDLTTPMLESARRRIRALVQLIEKGKRKPIYTDFEDEMGLERLFEISSFTAPSNLERFRAKARDFLRAHQDHITIYKLRRNESLTPSDMSELERMLVEAGVGSAAEIARAKDESQGLGLFIRSLVGLDREAAKRAFGEFMANKTLTANQIEFLNLIIDHLTEHGVMEPGRLYESPFTDISPRGPEGVFSGSEVDRIIFVLNQIRRTAAS